MIDQHMSTYIHLSKYARWIEKENRRETWDETVDRLYEYWYNRLDCTLEDKTEAEFQKNYMVPLQETVDSVRDLEVMPSMRTLMTAGPALERDEVSGFNCSAIAINHQRTFDEIFYLLMCGCGVGFSVERQYINKLPEVAEEFYESDTTIKVGDSKIGWAKGLKELLAMLYNGDVPKWDVSLIRPAGARLKTFGGRASGPGPLVNLFAFAVRLFSKAKGRKLNSIECHDLVCKIADTVIAGSVRRSACISLSNLTDDRMRRAKMGQWDEANPERALANNSVAYTEKPDLISFLKEFRSLYQSKAGERGIINKRALQRKAESTNREHDGDYLLNPCGEAILRDTGGLCNLTEVIVRPEDTLEHLKSKVRSATILGTLQSTLTDFRYLRRVWSRNQEEERLLGVSLTGIMDHPVLSGREMDRSNPSDPIPLEDYLQDLKGVATETNKEWAEKLGIPESTQLTLVKPSGTVSQLTGTSSGIHPRYAPYYLRRVVQDQKDRLTDFMIEQGVPHVVKGEKTIFTFPIKSPEGAVCASDIGAMNQLELWKIYQEYWCEGNPSQTIYYTDDEFIDVQSWVWKNWNVIGGLSFFPKDDAVYDEEMQPYLEVTEEQYGEALGLFPKAIAWEKLGDFEKEDTTQMEKEMACTGGNCEV